MNMGSWMLSRLGPRHIRMVGLLLAVGVFVLDVRVPDTGSVGLLYVLVLLLGLWMPGPRDVLALAGFVTVLTGLEYAISPPLPDHWTVNLVNHGLQVTVMWVTACGIALFRRTLDQRELAVRQAKMSESRLREQDSLAHIGKMAAVVAHEVRNPLAGIRSAVQVLSRDLPGSALEREIALDAIGCIDALNGIVTDLLQFARPIHPAVAATAFGAIIRPTIALLHDDPLTANVQVHTAGEDVVVPADPQLLKLVLHNLLLNSAQAVNGRGAIHATAAVADGVCEIRVADSGPGIPPAVRPHLFEPFFTTKIRGTGLGLATVRRLVHAHGGTVEVACPPEGGTTVVVKLPLEIGEAA